MTSLAGKVALITGTAGGQGAAAAELFAAAGASVVGCDIAPADGSEPVDLTDEDAVRHWVDAAGEAYGRIDILYANAGATRFSPLEETTKDEWDWVLRHELDVVFFPVTHAWRHLKKSDAPAVILVGSTAGITGSMTTPESRTP